VAKKTKDSKRGKRHTRSKSRRLSLKVALILVAFLGLWGGAGAWFVRHPRVWLHEKESTLPTYITRPLAWFGNPIADLTDALDLTGHDAVYEYDTEAPSGSITFAGVPRRVGKPAPDDIRILHRGEFLIGWSDKLRHPVWCAYHVRKQAPYDNGKRPGFTKDGAVPRAPSPADYTKTGYDRGHMVPNFAIVTRYGETAQRKTFMMSNVAPQTPALNRGVWRDLEHRIAELWTARYGEIWVVVGCMSNSRETLSGTDIDVPREYYQIIIAQEGMDVRALAVRLSQNVRWNEWAARNIVSIAELEEATGLDFNPDLPSFIQSPLESEVPTRLWPIRIQDVFKLIALRFR